MKAYLRVINSLFIIAAVPAHHVSSQFDLSCASIDPNLNSQLFPFDTISLSCHPVWNPHGFILRYAQAGPSTWNFVLSAPDASSYIAIGFSSTGRMVGSSAVVGWVAAGGAAQSKQYYLGGQTPFMVVPDQGNLFIVPNSSTVISTSSRIYLAFQLTTDRPSSHLLYAVGPAGFYPAGSTFQLSQHRDMTSTSFNYATGETDYSEGWPYSTLRTWHGILSMVGWGILIPIGVIIARYFKHWDPLWFVSHVTVQSLGLAIGAAGVICGLVLENKSMLDVTKHKAIGITIIVLGCIQVAVALCRPGKCSKDRRYWNWFHHNVGRAIVILAVANVFYGISLAKPGSDWYGGYGLALGVLVVTALVLELRLWTKK